MSVAATRAIPNAAGAMARMSLGTSGGRLSGGRPTGSGPTTEIPERTARSRTTETIVDPDHRDEDAGHARPPIPQAEDDDQAGDPDRQGDSIGLTVPDAGHERAAALEDAVAARAEPEQPGQLADHDDQRDAVEVALPHRRGQKIGQEPEPGDTPPR